MSTDRPPKDSLASLAADAALAMNRDGAATPPRTAVRASSPLLVPAGAVSVFVVTLLVLWPALSGTRERAMLATQLEASLSTVAHILEDYAGMTGQLPDSLGDIGLGRAALAYTHDDSTYTISMQTPTGEPVTHRGVVHLRRGGL